MKNLHVLRHKFTDFSANVVAQCNDADNGILFALTKDFKLFKTKNQANRQQSEIVEHNIDFLPHEIKQIEVDDVRLFEFVVESGSILLALRTGHITRIGVSSFSPSSECVYKHVMGISSIKLAPDQNLIAIADENDDINILSSDYEILYSNNASTQSNSSHKPVGVGWGSKETQFFGLDGRPSKEHQRRQPVESAPENPTTQALIETSDTFLRYRRSQERSTVIDWRGDGQYISTLTYYLSSGKHCLKVWNRNLDLLYMSEQLVVVERGLMAWVPNGHLICCAQRLDQNMNEIAMFEKNGMVHQRLTLPNVDPNVYIKDLTWSLDSKVLAILVYKFHIVAEVVHYTPILLLYTMQNFHYYLKSSLSLDENCEYFLKWDSISLNRLHLMSSQGQYSEYICSFETTSTLQLSTVAVVDASKVLVTPFEICNIPPPMSAIDIDVRSLISRLILNPSRADNMFILTMDSRMFYTSPRLNMVSNEESSVTYQLKHQVAAILHDRLKHYHIVDFSNDYENITPLDDFSLIASKSTLEGDDIFLLELPHSSSISEMKSTNLVSFRNRQIVAITRDTVEEVDGIAVILNDGSCHWVDISSRQTKSMFELQISDSIHKFGIISFQMITQAQSKVAVSLSQDLSLRLNADVVVANSCTSFRLSENYLVYTTSDNTIHFSLIEKLLTNRTELCESWTQQIENGGTLVIISEKDSKVILQMPRGNLEILHPRLLVLASLTQSLDRGLYVEAITMARRNRINMNFLCDYIFRLSHEHDQNELPKKFLLDVARYDASFLCLFLTELNDVDTIIGRYNNLTKHLPSRQVEFQKPPRPECKVDYMCVTWLKQDNHDMKMLKPTLLCHIKLKQLPDALHRIQGMDSAGREEALKFLLYFVSIDELFREALGTYNTEITLMVAGQSNKDPKEYLVLLNDFDKIENGPMRCYHIDIYLKRYDRALEHLAGIYKVTASEDLKDKILDLIVSKRLYKKALESFNTLLSIRDLIEPTWKKYADYLFEKRCYTEAGLAYSKALDINPTEEYLRAAVRAYLLADDCVKAAALVTRFGVDKPFGQESIKQILRQLIERDKCEQACVILRDMPEEKIKDYCRDIIKRGHWHMVEFILRGEIQNVTVRHEIPSHVLEYAREHIYRLESELKVVEDQFSRLEELLTSHARRANEEPRIEGFITDSLSTIGDSELSSTSSQTGGQPREARSGATSIKTRNSARTQNQRKKRINLKVGSSHEDMALVIELKKYLSKQKVNHQDTMRISAALFDYCDYDEAHDLTREMKKFLERGYKFSKEIVDMLWPPNELVEQKYSLYRRFSNILSQSNGCYENIDFEVLIKPDLPLECMFFEI